MSKRSQKKHQALPAATSSPSTTAEQHHLTQPFKAHLHELRRRLMFIALSVVLWGGAAYAVQQHIVAALLKPAHGEKFIYTNPGGGIDFLFRICLYTGLVISLPVILYNLLRYIEPLITKNSRRFIGLVSVASALLALGGVAFGYFLGLPAALHFLLHQFTTVQIQPLITIQSYLGFVIVYMVGSALLFQLPLLLITINRLTPLKPSRLLHYERWVILAAFVLAGLMNPSPNVISQLIVVVPFVVMYQIGILMIAIINRQRRVPKTAAAKVRPTPAKPVAAPAKPVINPPRLKPVMAAVTAAPVIASKPQPSQARPLAARPVVTPVIPVVAHSSNDLRDRFRSHPAPSRPRQYLDGFASNQPRLSNSF